MGQMALHGADLRASFAWSTVRTGIFEDQPARSSGTVTSRCPPFKVTLAGDQIDIETEHLHLRYQASPKG